MNWDDKVDVQVKVLKENEFSVEISHEIFKGIPIIEEGDKKISGMKFYYNKMHYSLSRVRSQI